MLELEPAPAPARFAPPIPRRMGESSGLFRRSKSPPAKSSASAKLAGMSGTVAGTQDGGNENSERVNMIVGCGSYRWKNDHSLTFRLGDYKKDCFGKDEGWRSANFLILLSLLFPSLSPMQLGDELGRDL